MRVALILCVAFVAQALASLTVLAAERPNVVWILSEDSSKHYLKLFDAHGAPTPNIAKLAADGIVFEHAFSCSPVCSVARTTLITGCYAPRIGTQFHRKAQLASLPDGLQMFPAYLRDAGYYTTNNSKKDYNAVEGSGVWDESSKKAHWRNRPSKDAPFFHMHTFTMSHESSLHFKNMQPGELQTSPEQVTLPPYFPDTPTFRYTLARYHDRMGVIDDAVGGLVKQLEADELLEETFIFYFGDHGGVLPRSKGYLYESGLHVPLVVRIPEKWKHLVSLERGTRAKGFVSFIDFGPTLLHLAGVKIPQTMDGRPFLGPDVTVAELNERDETFGYADRFDEKYEMCRSLRKGRYKYIRNYQAFYPDALQNNYRYIMLAYQEWRELHRADKLNAVQSQFFEPKPAELLFDLEHDPHEVHNLAGDEAHRETLATLRIRLQHWVKGMPDLSFYPESHLVEHALDAPVEFGKSHAEEIAKLVDTADLSLLPFDVAQPKLAAALGSSNRWVRYWALTACSVFGEEAKPLAKRVHTLLNDEELLVRMRAAEFLGLIGDADPRPALMDVLKTADSPLVALLTLNTVVNLRDGKPAYEFRISEQDVRAKGGEVRRRLEYLAP